MEDRVEINLVDVGLSTWYMNWSLRRLEPLMYITHKTFIEPSSIDFELHTIAVI